MEGDEITLFQQSPNEYVTGGRDCKQQVSNRHGRRGPERQQKPEIDRMTDHLVEQWCSEARRLGYSSLPMCIHLVKAEQVKMIDQKCADQDNNPSNPEERGKNHSTRRIAY